MFLKYVSALLAVWYTLSIIGFDVHACATSGNIFVNSVLGGTTCDVVHPEKDCNVHDGCSCCHGHDKPAAEDVLDEAGCCSNEIKVLDSDTIIISDDSDHVLHAVLSSCCYVEIHYDVQMDSFSEEVLYYPDPGDLIGPGSQAVFNVWRI